MKISSLNRTIPNNNVLISVAKEKRGNIAQNDIPSGACNGGNSAPIGTTENKSLAPIHFSNLTFGTMNVEMRFLLEQANRLKCAYSRRTMLSPYTVRPVYSKLEKRPNAQSAINLLTQYAKYMHDIESTVFDIFLDAPCKGKRDFQNILKEYAPQSLKNLKAAQYSILSRGNDIISELSQPVREQVLDIRKEASARIENNTFGRRSTLDMIKSIKGSPEDIENVIRLYRMWYKLPSSTKSLDAFIVKYAKEKHNAIAKRLISTAVATLEHIIPSHRKGSDELCNLLLVSARFNNDRDTMPLDEYIMLNPEIDIRGNLQKYIDDVIMDVNNPKSKFSLRSWYPQSIARSINEETSGKVKLDTEKLIISKNIRKECKYPERLSQKYIVSYK